MIVFRDLALATAISVSSALLVPQDANAFELTGAWATGAGTNAPRYSPAKDARSRVAIRLRLCPSSFRVLINVAFGKLAAELVRVDDEASAMNA